jgi:plastocyanin
MNSKLKIIISICVVSFFILTFSEVQAQNVPDWIKNTALWFGEGAITETEFLNAIKFLIENDIIVIESDTSEDLQPISKTMNIIIPNGNANIENTGFYIPLNAAIKVGTTAVWVNDDVVPHTIQSQDEEGNVVGLFNSAPLTTGQRFAYTFDEPGTYNYFCTLHPWRVGIVTVV